LSSPPGGVRCDRVIGYTRRSSHVSNIGLHVHLSFQSLQTSNYSSQRRRGERNGEGCPTPQPTRGLASVVSSPSGIWGRPSRKRFRGVSGAMLCDVMHLSACNSCLPGNERFPSPPLYWLVDLMFTVNFFRVWDTPNLNFWGLLRLCTSTVSTAF